MVVPGSFQPYGQQQRGPSCFDKVKMGFMMGACIGAATGLVLGGFTVWRYGFDCNNVSRTNVAIFINVCCIPDRT